MRRIIVDVVDVVVVDVDECVVDVVLIVVDVVDVVVDVVVATILSERYPVAPSVTKCPSILATESVSYSISRVSISNRTSSRNEIMTPSTVVMPLVRPLARVRIVPTASATETIS